MRLLHILNNGKQYGLWYHFFSITLKSLISEEKFSYKPPTYLKNIQENIRMALENLYYKKL
jgi:hypothetical protein